ncbi:MAG: zinc ribbon domain-containing protein [Halomonadaceae bacterium]|nr:MAG: zinc ribbon domain-containing protein [Halomonadaceae bacterium]
MPVYDYKCREHGHFHGLETLAQSAQPKACPVCGVMSARIIVIPPHIIAANQALRSAQARNEKSRHEPVFSNQESRAEELKRREHRHGKGCGCGHEPMGKSKMFYTADGKKIFPSMRPWMISH